MNRLLRCSIALGACPIIIGTLIYFTWRLTRWQWLEMMGLMTILIGIMAFFAGAFCLILHLKHESRAAQSSPFNALLVGGLLIANFPAAVFYTTSAIDISTRYILRVNNDSDHPIESFMILGPGIKTELGPIPVGGNAKHHFYPNAPGRLTFTARQMNTDFHGDLEGYVHKGAEGDKSVTIHGIGNYQITDNLD